MRPAAGPARAARRRQGLLRDDRRARRSQPGRADLGALIDALNRPPRRRGMAVVISDFLVAAGRSGRSRCASSAYATTCWPIEILDPRELELPDGGVMEFVDPETGAIHEVQTSDPQLRAPVRGRRRPHSGARSPSAIRGAGAAHLRLRTDSDWLFDIVRFVAAQRHARTRGTTR